ncbi:AAA family ATPase [Natronomonas sp. CBA1123]|uniref:ATP-dependent nuclease n=1 Tax=Natronomonas sp. CBA1123 TaxID=2668070 RepID=UPI0012EA2D95|nr:ATP-binding protein [Natronomonas sp. CBA1123]MUV87808.1 AAA family ATPase [Natronomonas sp. CBA1123]
MKLVTWDVDGYKSISNDQAVEMDQVNVFVGENNSGKSSVIDALIDYREAFPTGNSISEIDWLRKRIRGKELSGEIRFKFTFKLSDEEIEDLWMRIDEVSNLGQRKAERYVSDGQFRRITHQLILRPDPESESGIAGQSNMYATFNRGGETEWRALRRGNLSSAADFQDFAKLPENKTAGKRKAWAQLKEVMQEAMEEWEYIKAFREPEEELDAVRKLRLDDEGHNLSQVLLSLIADQDPRFKKISEEYSRIMPGVEGISAPLRGDQTTVVVEEEEFGEFDLSEISAGSKEILTLVTQIVLAGDDADVLLMEEPELHLHPGAERKVLQLIEDELMRDSGPQIVISTHSSVFVNHDSIDNRVRVKRDVESQLIPTGQDEVGAELREIGYRYSGMLQSDAVVIVEGLTDRKVLRNIGPKYGFDLEENRIGLADMDCKSKLINHSRSLVKLLDVFSIPYLFICDSDVSQEFDGVNSGSKVEAIRGKIIQHINRTGDGDDAEISWEKADENNVHVWHQNEIEAYLLEDQRAVASCFSMEEENVIELLETHSAKDPAEQLGSIVTEARGEFDAREEAFVKKVDVPDLAREVKIANLPPEFHNVMEKIAALVDRQDIIQDNRPDRSGD